MIYHDDCIKVMKTLPSNKIDMVFADPPYFLSNGGLSIHSGKIVSVNKGEWDKASNYENISQFNCTWLNECYRLLKNGGTIWVSGTQHNIFDVYQQMTKIGFKIINIIVWHKIDPPPLIYKHLTMMKCLKLIMKKCMMYGIFQPYKCMKKSLVIIRLKNQNVY